MSNNNKITNFKFYRKGDEYIWENCDLKLIFSNAHFQTIDDYAYVKNINEIMYLYYNVKLYRNEEKYDEEKDKEFCKWIKVGEVSPYDFPTLLQLKYFLNHLLNEKIEIDECRKITFYHEGEPIDRVGYEYIMESEGFETEDHYRITRLLTIDEKGKESESFDIYIGISYGYKPTSSYGIDYKDVTRKDLEILLKCINSFIDDAIVNHNEATLERNRKSSKSFKLRNGMLYKYNDENIDDIFEIGQSCSLTIASHNIEDENMYSINYNNCIIKEIKENSLIINGGNIEVKYEYKINNKDIEIPFFNILYFTSHLDDDEKTRERLYYGEEKILEDFYSILDKEAINEFKTCDKNFLFKKWGEAICDRSWMCRNEHNFTKYVEDNGYHENVIYIIETIIEKLKEKCSN